MDVYLLILFYILKKVCWEIEKEYFMCVVNLLCFYINFILLRKFYRERGEKMLLLVDDKFKLWDICLDMDINIY